MTGPTVTAELLERYAEKLNSRPSLQRFGVRIWFPDASRLKLRIDTLSEGMRGGMSDDTIVNGGVLSALCDLAIGCTTALVDPTKPSATMQLSIRFEQPLRGDSVEGEGRIDRATRRFVFSSAELFDPAGQVCVRCQGMATLVERKAALKTP